jgi:crossover junction endonuclease MUS81
VLDYVVERKTDADLVGSITDGRFKEQKHRLSRSCLRNIIYLFEGHGDGPSIATIGPERYFAAVCQTPIQDGFFSKRTRSLEETFQFIHDLYVHVQDKYQDKDLQFVTIGANVEFDRDLLSNIIAESGNVHQSFALYAAMNTKTANWTFKDIFIQQLMTIKGVTGEKAVQIARKYPSPVELYEEYRVMPNEQARELLFAEWQSEVPGKERKYGPALSRRIYEVFWAHEYPTSHKGTETANIEVNVLE